GPTIPTISLLFHVTVGGPGGTETKDMERENLLEIVALSSINDKCDERHFDDADDEGDGDGHDDEDDDEENDDDDDDDT
ncbi:hypothetical protein SK128_013102, partial [Halocaridina rubra]